MLTQVYRPAGFMHDKTIKTLSVLFQNLFFFLGMVQDIQICEPKFPACSLLSSCRHLDAI